MKIFLILLVFSLSLSAVVSIKDYCEMEKRLCGTDKHIGCEKNAFKNMESLFSLKLGTITSELRELMLDKINTFRSQIATGQKTPFKSASNMRLVTWNSEMEFLSSQLVLKLPRSDFACCKTDTFPKALELHHGKNEVLAPAAFLTWAFEHMFNYTVEQRTASQLKFSFFYAANLTSIGCAFGSYKDRGDKMVLKCVKNEPEATSFPKTYLPGDACSKCSSFNQTCSERYPGICEDVKVLPVGPQGPIGPAGPPGLPGAPGPRGAPGERGLNGTNGVNGVNGVNGFAGIDGRNGEKGEQGPIGPVGPKGDTGLQGVKGERGIDGMPGPPGVDGKPGKNGDGSSTVGFWIMHCIVAAGVGVALFIAFRAKRAAEGFPTVSYVKT